MPNLLRINEFCEERPAARPVRIALAGNPNSGKTTIFNALTGARQHVGNYPGVTVEKIEGICRCGEMKIQITDLPGSYSLTAYSAEEIIARDFLIHGKPDVVIDILDAGNLERNLYLAVQIMELGCPVALAMNMSDVAQQRGIQFDLNILGDLLGVPVIATIGHKGIGVADLLQAAVDVGGEKRSIKLRIDYGREIESEIVRLQKQIEQEGLSAHEMPSRWMAIKLLEKDAELRKKFAFSAILAAADQSVENLESLLGDSVEALIAERRYKYISEICLKAVRSSVESRHSLSDRIDAIATHRLLGLPIFLALMYLVFQLTFTLGEPPMGWIESGFSRLSEVIGGLWPDESESLLRSLLVDGIIGGAGGVLVFLPNILLLFLAIAVLEDSGYMARAAFLMDRLMHKIGLHGKSFVPMLIGFGCSVPAIMATRTLENRKDRLTTMLVVPLMSCGARLPIYALIIPAFFPEKWHAPMLWLIYLIGIALAIGCARLLKMTVLRGEASLEFSWMGRIGRGLEPLLRPCGFDWKISTAMIGAFAAKEVFVSQMGIVYSLGEEQNEESETLREKLQAAYTPLQGFCIMLFCLVSAPCIATIAITKRESNSWKWALFQLAGLTILAWVITAGVYQIGIRI